LLAHEANISHKDTCWVFGKAKVYGNAVVNGNAKIYSEAQVFQDARVGNRAEVSESAIVCGYALVRGDATIRHNAMVYGYATVGDEACVCKHSCVYDMARVEGKTYITDRARVYGKAYIGGEAEVHNSARVWDESEVCGKTIIAGGSNVCGRSYINGNRCFVSGTSLLESVYLDGDIRIVTHGVIIGAYLKGEIVIRDVSLTGYIVLEGNYNLIKPEDFQIVLSKEPPLGDLIYTKVDNKWHYDGSTYDMNGILEMFPKDTREIIKTIDGSGFFYRAKRFLERVLKIR